MGDIIRAETLVGDVKITLSFGELIQDDEERIRIQNYLDEVARLIGLQTANGFEEKLERAVLRALRIKGSFPRSQD